MPPVQSRAPEMTADEALERAIAYADGSVSDLHNLACEFSEGGSDRLVALGAAYQADAAKAAAWAAVSIALRDREASRV